jgi:glucose dehydrogenase
MLAPIAALVLAVTVPTAAGAQGDLRKPAGNEWLTIGGDWHNTRYSTLAAINRDNVRGLKAAWVTHLGSGLGLKYSMEGTPMSRTASCTSRPATTTSSRSMPRPAR